MFGDIYGARSVLLSTNLVILNGPLKGFLCLLAIFSKQYLIIDLIIIIHPSFILMGHAIINFNLFVMAYSAPIIYIIYGDNHAATENQLDLTLFSKYFMC